MSNVNTPVSIPDNELFFSFARSGGPGGQNVNKVSTKAVLRWNIAHSEAIRAHVKTRFIERFKNRINDEGEVVISSDRYRSQNQNKADCIERLNDMIQTVLHPPKPRKATKPTRASKERRINTKRHNAAKKQLRKRPRMDD